MDGGIPSFLVFTCSQVVGKSPVRSHCIECGLIDRDCLGYICAAACIFVCLYIAVCSRCVACSGRSAFNCNSRVLIPRRAILSCASLRFVAYTVGPALREKNGCKSTTSGFCH